MMDSKVPPGPKILKLLFIFRVCFRLVYWFSYTRMAFWRRKEYLHKALTDEELLRAAEEISNELAEELPLDNSPDTDIESDFDDDDNNIQPDTTEREPMLIDAGEDDVQEPDTNVTEDISSGAVNIEGIPGSSNEQNDDMKTFDRRWKKRDLTINVPKYDNPEGPLCDEFLTCHSPTDYFKKVVGTALADVTYQSNLYATQKNKNLNLKEEELLAFLGINFFMGYHTLPSYKHYWSTSNDLGIELVRKTMTRNRFQDILSFLHVNDNDAIPANNKNRIYKILPLVNTLNENFNHLHHGTREMAVDESMIVFKGRSTLKQYNPMKPIKRGYKLWCLADQRGYVKKFEIYQGKNVDLQNKFKDYGLGERVVLHLTESEWGKFRKIYFDNFFTSIHLLERLKIEKTLGCGTIRSSRKDCPHFLIEDKKMKRGDFDFRVSKTDISFFKWKDNKCVYFASNFHGTQTCTVGRKEKDGSKSQIPCPEIVADYNRHMGAVDHADQLRGSYCVDRKSKKWWHRLFFGLLDIAFINSFIIYTELEDKMTLLDFRRSVAQGLMNGNLGCLRTGKKNRCSAEQRNSPVLPPKRRKYNYTVCQDVRLGNRGSHWVTFTGQRGRCEQCSSKAIQSRPHSKCTACGVFLCCNEKKNCFAEYHGVNEN